MSRVVIQIRRAGQHPNAKPPGSSRCNRRQWRPGARPEPQHKVCFGHVGISIVTAPSITLITTASRCICQHVLALDHPTIAEGVTMAKKAENLSDLALKKPEAPEAASPAPAPQTQETAGDAIQARAGQELQGHDAALEPGRLASRSDRKRSRPASACRASGESASF